MAGLRESVTGITDKDIEYAYSMGNRYGLPKEAGVAGGVGNKGDAARHVTLGYLAAIADKDRGTYNWSKNLVQLKEFSPLTRRDADSKMDMHNNAIGMQIAMLVGDDKEAFERTLDSLMQSSKQIQSVDDFSSDFRSMSPVYIEPGYRIYAGGPTAMTNPNSTTKPASKPAAKSETIKTVPGVKSSRK